MTLTTIQQKQVTIRQEAQKIIDQEGLPLSVMAIQSDMRYQTLWAFMKGKTFLKYKNMIKLQAYIASKQRVSMGVTA